MRRTLQDGLVAGLAASWVKVLSEPWLQKQAERLLPPSPREKALVGADPTGRPDNMPPAVLADRLATRLLHESLTPPQRIRAAQVLHYLLGAVLGVFYTAARERWTLTARGRGAPAGLVLYAGTHGSALAALGIQDPPWRLPPAAVLWESTSHVVFGLALEATSRLEAPSPAG
jgi:putative membrane protein